MDCWYGSSLDCLKVLIGAVLIELYDPCPLLSRYRSFCGVAEQIQFSQTPESLAESIESKAPLKNVDTDLQILKVVRDIVISSSRPSPRIHSSEPTLALITSSLGRRRVSFILKLTGFLAKCSAKPSLYTPGATALGSDVAMRKQFEARRSIAS
ncbi:hypothetical protein BDZ45DRAFT_676894 [Acephala macrosclerotiorum]|nr:hypothetical protein BDZ45DRAFT_676894 [Acephala macrosclerotiorum]